MALGAAHKKVIVDPQLLLDAAAELESHASTAGDVFDQLNNMFWCMGAEGQWAGTAFLATLEATADNAAKFAPVAEELENLAAFLRKVANTMAQADADASDHIKAI